MDIRNALSLAGMLGAMYESVGDEFSDELFFNTDVTSLLLKDHQDSVYVPFTIIDWAKAQNLAVSETKDQSFQERSVSLMTTISAAGKLLCTRGHDTRQRCQTIARNQGIRWSKME